jgi:hypothetical protein
MWSFVGSTPITNVKFVQVGSDRFQYQVRVNFGSFTMSSIFPTTNSSGVFVPQSSLTVSSDPGANSSTVRQATFLTGVTSSASLGIGVTNPSYALHVSGTETSGGMYTTGQLYINNTYPTIYLQDTDHRSAMIHCNGNLLYFLRGSGTNSTGWLAINGQWPCIMNLENNDMTVGGNFYVSGNLMRIKSWNLYQDGYNHLYIQNDNTGTNAGPLINGDPYDVYGNRYSARLTFRNSASGENWNIRGPYLNFGDRRLDFLWDV